MPNDGKNVPGQPPGDEGHDGRASPADPYDVVIVGAGPAGLEAALILGRCRRRVLVIDSGRPRNAAARAVHGYLSRDGLDPRELHRIGLAEIARYGVEFLPNVVASARALPGEGGSARPMASFEVTTEDGRSFRSRKLLLATGVKDILPPIEGVGRFYGLGVHHCPYCDGWEHRQKTLVAFGAGRKAVGLALSLRTWSDRVIACTDGEPVTAKDRGRLVRNDIALRTERVARLVGSEVLEGVVFASGPPQECDAFFFSTDQVQHSPLMTLLGCEIEDGWHVRTANKQRTSAPGLFLAGDAAGDVQFVIVAAAEGARAAVAINREIQDEDRGEVRANSRPSKKAKPSPAARR